MGRAFGDILLERIEIDYDEVQGRYFVLLHLLAVAGIVAPCEDAAENFGMQGLYPSAED